MVYCTFLVSEVWTHPDNITMNVVVPVEQAIKQRHVLSTLNGIATSSRVFADTSLLGWYTLGFSIHLQMIGDFLYCVLSAKSCPVFCILHIPASLLHLYRIKREITKPRCHYFMSLLLQTREHATKMIGMEISLRSTSTDLWLGVCVISSSSGLWF